MMRNPSHHNQKRRSDTADESNNGNCGCEADGDDSRMHSSEDPKMKSHEAHLRKMRGYPDTKGSLLGDSDDHHDDWGPPLSFWND